MYLGNALYLVILYPTAASINHPRLPTLGPLPR
jgi:hypothetical protein